MSDAPARLTDQVIDGFNKRDYAGAVAALKMLQDQDSRDEPQQWQRHIAAINANVDLQKLGIKDAGQIVSVTEKGELITADPSSWSKQVRAADSALTLRQSSALYSVRGDVLGMPMSRDPKVTSQLDSVDDLRQQAEKARLNSLPAGDHKLSITVDGQQRVYDVHVPANPDGKPMPVYYALHGAGLFEAPRGEMASELNLNELADKRKFIAVYPYSATHEEDVTGTAYAAGKTWNLDNQHITYHSWNSPGAGMNVVKPDYDDVNYIKAVRDNVARQLNIDPSRQYIIGFSEGAEFANQLAARLPFAGIASIHGTHLGTEAPPTRPTAFLSITSELDGVLPRDGSPGKYNSIFPRLATSQPMRQFDVWRQANGCNGHVQANLTPESQTTSYAEAQCASGRPVVDINRFSGHHSIDGNYTIGSAVAGLIGEWKNHQFNAAITAIDFLQKYRLSQ